MVSLKLGTATTPENPHSTVNAPIDTTSGRGANPQNLQEVSYLTMSNGKLLLDNALFLESLQAAFKNVSDAEDDIDLCDTIEKTWVKRFRKGRETSEQQSLRSKEAMF